MSYCDGATLEPRDLSIKGWGIGFGSNSGVGLRIPGAAEHLELLMVEAGLTPMQAITNATSNAAALLNSMIAGCWSPASLQIWWSSRVA